MPRTPEVCSSLFCPPDRAVINATPILTFDSPLVSRLIAPAIFFLLFAAFTSSVVKVYAQGATATLSGTVTDQNDAVVPGVRVAVISIEKGFQRSTSTNGEGTFVVPLLPPGTYTIK